MEIFAFILIGAAVIGFFAWQAHLKKKRMQAIESWARSHGLAFDPSEDSSVDGRYPGFSCLQQGENRYAYNSSSGRWNGCELLGFDYHYETYSRDSKGRRRTHHHHFSAVVVSSALPLKPLFVRPEGFLDRVGEFFGWDDIDFESIEFSRRFFVKSPDRRWAFDVIHQRTMEHLLASPVFTIEFGPREAIAYRSSTFAPEEFEAAAQVLRGVLDRFPEYLVKQQREFG